VQDAGVGVEVVGEADGDELVVVGEAGGAAGGEGEVVVVEDTEGVVVEDDHVFDGGEGEGEGVGEAADVVGVGQVEEIGDEGFVELAVVVAVAFVGEEDLLVEVQM
jgi:hypothetical protein